MSPQFKPKFGKLLAVAGTLIGLGGCATSLPTSSAMQIGEVAVAPSGFMSFCQREPQECGLGGVQSNAELDAALAGANRAQWSALFAQAPGGFRGGFRNVTSTAPGLPLKDGYGWAELFAANNAATATPAQTPPVEEIALADDASLQVSTEEPAATRAPLQIAEVSVRRTAGHTRRLRRRAAAPPRRGADACARHGEPVGEQPYQAGRGCRGVRPGRLLGPAPVAGARQPGATASITPWRSARRWPSAACPPARFPWPSCAPARARPTPSCSSPRIAGSSCWTTLAPG